MRLALAAVSVGRRNGHVDRPGDGRRGGVLENMEDLAAAAEGLTISEVPTVIPRSATGCRGGKLHSRVIRYGVSRFRCDGDVHETPFSNRNDRRSALRVAARSCSGRRDRIGPG